MCFLYVGSQPVPLKVAKINFITLTVSFVDTACVHNVYTLNSSAVSVNLASWALAGILLLGNMKVRDATVY